MENSNKCPSKKYPTPPFGDQPQSPPGVELKMNPIPDYGEESYKGHDLLKDKVVIVTGGDSGIGKAICLAMAREGASVVIAYKDAIEDVDAVHTQERVEEAGSKSMLFKGDLREEDMCKKLIDEVVREFGRIDVLVNNAAYQMTYDSLQEITAEEWNKTFEVNLSAMFYLIKFAQSHIPPGGSIINTTSVNAYDPNPTLIPYAASKAAIQSFTSSLALKFMSDGVGIRVNAVAPGPVWTPLIPSTIDDHSEFGQDSPIGRPAQPAEIAPIYVFLASDSSSYISGATIPVTGGRITI